MEYPTPELLQHGLCFAPTEDKTPRFLYHYTKYESAIKILANGYLFMRSLENQNDPWEFLPRENHIVDCGESLKESAQNLKKHSMAIDERNNYVRQASFSIDTNLRHGWNLTRMWAQYADNHAGVCLIFDYKQLYDDFNAAFADKATHYACRQINYVNLYELDNLEDKYWKPTTTFFHKDFIDLLFTKHDDFAQEQEYRFLAAIKDLKTSDENLRLPIKKSFCGLITGKRFEQKHEENINRLRIKHLRDAMELCNKDVRPIMMYSHKFAEPLYDPIVEQEFFKKLMDSVLTERNN